MKIAIVHDWLYGGGAEKVVEQLHKIYPDAPIYTSYATQEWKIRLDNKVITGYLNWWPFGKLRKFLPLLRQWWFRGLDLSEYDVVISSSGNGEARFAEAPPHGIHISYTHTPPHFYWRKYDQYLKNPSFKPKWLVRIGLRVLVGYLRKRDYEAAQKIDFLIANSEHIKNDIWMYYNRESTVIHPPVETARFLKKTNSRKSFNHRFIMWGRLVPYKRFDLAIEACNELGAELDIIGDGPELANLRMIAGSTIRFLGRASDEALEDAAQQADAFLFPGEEDFGIAPVEALSAGLPVIAYRSGGALDYVKAGKTGVVFVDQTKQALIDAIKRFHPKDFDPKTVALFAITNFDTKLFQQKMRKYVDDAISRSRLSKSDSKVP